MWLLILGIAVGLILSLIGMFIGNISLFESIASGIILALVVFNLWQFSPVISVGIGIAAAAVLYAIQKTAIGFWIVGGVFSVAWGLIVAVIVFDATGRIMLWTYIGWALGTIAFFGLHLIARSRQKGQRSY
jgi:hypothetical protein